MPDAGQVQVLILLFGWGKSWRTASGQPAAIEARGATRLAKQSKMKQANQLVP
jgi:hypothetical protein